MTGYVRETKHVWSEECPFHGTRFRKKGKFWHCPGYGECGYSIGSRRLVGQRTTMWVRQSQRGRAWTGERAAEAATRWWDSWPFLFSCACYVAAGRPPLPGPPPP